MVQSSSIPHGHCTLHRFMTRHQDDRMQHASYSLRQCAAWHSFHSWILPKESDSRGKIFKMHSCGLARRNQQTGCSSKAKGAATGSSMAIIHHQCRLTMYMWFRMRWIGYYYPKEMSAGGVFWLTDLARSDPLMLLPILSGTCSILVFEVRTEIREMSKKQ